MIPPATIPASYKGLLKLYQDQPKELRDYFEHFPKLMTASLPYEIAIAYLFSRVERAHRRALYCGITKKYSANSDLVDDVVRREFVSRDSFKRMFATVFGKEMPKNIAKLIEDAEFVRDKGIHGKDPDDKEMRKAMHDIFKYADEFNNFVSGLESFRPFGDLRGFKGRGENLDKETTRWILKGLGFSIQ